ncbi:hypothetical protein KFV05_08800 [Macrococcoides canis]|uniref:DUF6612 family protein n=1 Tax=Macrococcoides canis TaxID=1855823 RepID=UPI0020B90195|nr:DUF6612 family protein [Macrococcus canis]UTH01809.1 hypothetical protein KFV05_08800 [Macrococcus canis]
MKSRLLPLLLGSTLIFAACGQEEKQTEDTKTEEKATEEKTTETASEKTSHSSSSKIKDAETLVAKVQEKGKDIDSYNASLITDVKLNDKEDKMKMEMVVDNNNNVKITREYQDQIADIYVFNDKIIVTKDDKTFINATNDLDKYEKKQIKELDYNSVLKTLNAYKDSNFELVDDGYKLTKKINNKKELLELNKKTGSASSFKDKISDAKGTVTFHFDKDFILRYSLNKLDINVDGKKMSTKTEVKYDQYNQVKAIEIPEGAKNAQSIEELQKSQETSTEKAS